MDVQTIAPAKPTTAEPRTDADHYRAFGKAIDLIRKKVEAEMGDEDVDYVKRLDRFSHTMETIGRALIHTSVEPTGFTAGVIALWIHKQLQCIEIGHTSLHGGYDKLKGAEAYHSKSYVWDVPIDEESWKRGHNIAHHGNTNVAGKDRDIHFGFVRLTDQTPHTRATYWQLPFTLLLAFPNFGWMMNMHFTGMIDLYAGNGRDDDLDFIEDRSRKTARDVHKRVLRKLVPYYAKNYLFYPALAGPMFFKVLFGNWLAETMRDVYSAATIYCGHVGEDTATYDEGSQARSRGEWYAMQAEATNNFEVNRPLSILCGGLDLQIEHHMFPKLPPHRLRQVSKEVKSACAEHGVAYRTASWPRTLAKSLKQIAKLSVKGEGGPFRRFKTVMNVMA
jgi:linoleoyl-CoA desaturase